MYLCGTSLDFVARRQQAVPVEYKPYVFLIDSQGNPLMPLTAAHARELEKAGDARRIKHHALPIFQLLRSTQTEQIRAVACYIVVQSQAAELFVVADGADKVYPLLSLVVDMRWPSGIQRKHSKTWAQASVATLEAVVHALQEILPVTNAGLLDPIERLRGVPKFWIPEVLEQKQLMVDLLQQLAVSGIIFYWHEGNSEYRPRGVEIDATLAKFISNATTYAPQYVVHDRRWPIKPMCASPQQNCSSELQTSLQTVGRGQFNHVRPGSFCTGREQQNGRTLYGLAARDDQEGSLLLLSPTCPNPETVRWEQTHLSDKSSIRVRPTRRLVFLPVSHFAKGQSYGST